MSPVLVGMYLWLWGLISGILFGAHDKKYSAQSILAMLLLPGLGLALLLLIISLVWEIAPLISLGSASREILEFFSNE